MTDTIPEQLQRRREAASRLEPLDCGHRDPLDCTDQCRGIEATVSIETGGVPEFDPGDIAGLWADAKSLFFAADFPEYASAEWRALHPDDPRRLAAALDAAEKWRKYGDENVIDSLRQASAPRPPIWQRGPSHAERKKEWKRMYERADKDWADRRAATTKTPETIA